MESKNILEIFQKLLEYEEMVNEATVTSGSGTYRGPLSPGLKLWDKNTLEPFTVPLEKFDNAQLYVDALDGNIDTKNIKTKEKVAKKFSNYDKKHPVLNDDDGSDLNDNPLNKKLLKKVLGKNQIKKDLAVLSKEGIARYIMDNQKKLAIDFANFISSLKGLIIKEESEWIYNETDYTTEILFELFKQENGRN